MWRKAFSGQLSAFSQKWTTESRMLATESFSPAEWKPAFAGMTVGENP